MAPAPTSPAGRDARSPDIRVAGFVAQGTSAQERFEQWRTWHLEALGSVALERLCAVSPSFTASAKHILCGATGIVEVRCGPAAGGERRRRRKTSSA